MNTIHLIGRLVAEPEIKQNESLSVCKYRLAVSRGNSSNSEKQNVDFFSCSCIGKSADFASKYFKKGLQIGVVGKMRLNEYEKDGNKKTFPEVLVNEQYFADKAEK